jgi:hypothetical protein
MRTRLSKLLVASALLVSGLIVAQASPAAATTYCSPAPQPMTPYLTVFGVRSDTNCGTPGSGSAVDATCNQVLTGFGWITNPSGGSCSSNGDLVDFGPCQSGTWTYRTLSLINGIWFDSPTAQITC